MEAALLSHLWTTDRTIMLLFGTGVATPAIKAFGGQGPLYTGLFLS